MLANQLDLLRSGLGVRRIERFPEDLLANRHVAPLLRREIGRDVGARAAEVEHRAGEIEADVDLPVR